MRADQHGYSWKFLAKEARASLGMASKYRRNPLLERGATGTDEHALYYTANRRIKELEEKWPLPRKSATCLRVSLPRPVSITHAHSPRCLLPSALHRAGCRRGASSRS